MEVRPKGIQISAIIGTPEKQRSTAAMVFLLMGLLKRVIKVHNLVTFARSG